MFAPDLSEDPSPKHVSLQQQRCFSLAGILNAIYLKIRRTSLFKIRNGAHQNSVALLFFLLRDARFVFYLVFSLFLN